MNNMFKQYMFAIRQISTKDTKKKTDDTSLGFIWNIASPLLYMIIMSTYYSNIITHNVYKYPVFVMMGYVVINYYTQGTTGAMLSIVKNRNLIIRSKMPKELFIYQRVYLAFKDFIYTSIALIMVMVFFRIEPSWRVLLMGPILLLTTILIIGIGKILAVIYIFFADVEYLYSVFMTLMYCVSGVFLTTDHLPINIQIILSYNPIFLAIYLTRNCLMYNLPSYWSAWVKLTLWSLGSAVIGNYLFKKYNNQIVNKM